MPNSRRIPLLLGAAALVFSLSACQDETPLGNNAPAEIADQPQFQPTNQQATFGNLVAALNNINVQIDQLSALNDLTIGDVTVVNVEDLLNGNRVRALNNALNRNEVDIAVLQDFLNNSPILNESIRNILNNSLNEWNVLNDANITLNDVIAISVLSGDITLFVQP